MFAAPSLQLCLLARVFVACQSAHAKFDFLCPWHWRGRHLVLKLILRFFRCGKLGACMLYVLLVMLWMLAASATSARFLICNLTKVQARSGLYAEMPYSYPCCQQTHAIGCCRFSLASRHQVMHCTCLVSAGGHERRRGLVVRPAVPGAEPCLFILLCGGASVALALCQGRCCPLHSYLHAVPPLHGHHLQALAAKAAKTSARTLA